jgi:hypothetical protein
MFGDLAQAIGAKVFACSSLRHTSGLCGMGSMHGPSEATNQKLLVFSRVNCKSAIRRAVCRTPLACCGSPVARRPPTLSIDRPLSNGDKFWKAFIEHWREI